MTPPARLMIGGYSPDGGAGQVVLVEIRETGELVLVKHVSTAPSPSFLTSHPRLPLYYAVSEDKKGALVAVEDAGAHGLRPRHSVSTGLSFPCHVTIDPTGSVLAATGYDDGVLALIDLNDDGIPRPPARLFRHAGSGPHPTRQTHSHFHQAVFVDEDHLLVTDLGSDSIHRFVRDAGGSGAHAWGAATEGSVPLEPGSGPRHLVVDGRFRHVVGELDATLSSYQVGADRRWEKISSTATTRHAAGALPSHVALHGGHLYVANRGPDTLAVFELGDNRPRLLAETPCGGVSPRHFVTAGSHVFVANEESHLVSTLVLTGSDPIPRATPYSFPTRSPACVLVQAPAVPPDGGPQ